MSVSHSHKTETVVAFRNTPLSKLIVYVGVGIGSLFIFPFVSAALTGKKDAFTLPRLFSLLQLTCSLFFLSLCPLIEGRLGTAKLMFDIFLCIVFEVVLSLSFLQTGSDITFDASFFALAVFIRLPFPSKSNQKLKHKQIVTFIIRLSLFFVPTLIPSSLNYETMFFLLLRLVVGFLLIPFLTLHFHIPPPLSRFFESMCCCFIRNDERKKQQREFSSKSKRHFDSNSSPDKPITPFPPSPNPQPSRYIPRTN